MTTCCTFWLGDLLLAIDVLRVQEILPGHETIPVPLADETVYGLLNVRGQIYTALDLRRRFHLPGEAPGMHIMLRSDTDAVTLRVDAVGDVVELDALERPPETLLGVTRELTLGACRKDDRMVLVLDVDRAVFSKEKG